MGWGGEVAWGGVSCRVCMCWCACVCARARACVMYLRCEFLYVCLFVCACARVCVRVGGGWSEEVRV